MPSLKSSPLKNRPKPKIKGMVFQPAFFRGKLAVSFRECIPISMILQQFLWGFLRPWEWSMKEQQTKHFEETKPVVRGSEGLVAENSRSQTFMVIVVLPETKQHFCIWKWHFFVLRPCSSGRLSARWYSHEHGRQLHQPSWDDWTWPSCSRRLWEYQADNTLYD